MPAHPSPCKATHPARPTAVPIAALSLLIPLSLAAADSVRMDTVVVTGTRSERALKDVPVRTEVVSKREIQTKHARDLAQALRHTPGVQLKEIHGKGGTEVWLQGLDSDRVLVLIDGLPVTASTGSTVDLTQISTTAIERVEIVKGAVSSLYGSEAIGGVINVITRSDSDDDQLLLIADSGNFAGKDNASHLLGNQYLSLDGKFGTDAIKARLNFTLKGGDGFDLSPDVFGFEGDRGYRRTQLLELTHNSSARTSYAYRIEYYNEDKERDFATFLPAVGDIEKIDGEEVSRLNQRFTWQRKAANNKQSNLSFTAMHEGYTDITRQDVVVTDVVDQLRDARIETTRLEFQYDRQLFQGHYFTFGGAAFNSGLDQFQTRIENGATRFIEEITPNAEQRNVDLFAQDDVFIGEQWELLPGVRWQNDSNFGQHVAPRINAMYVPETFFGLESLVTTKVRMGIGRGYRVPNLKERFFIFDHSALGYQVLGNSDLQPEESDSYQLSAEFSDASGRYYDISLFRNDFDRLITTSLDTEESAERQLQVFRYQNIPSARTQGVELKAVTPLSDNRNLTVGYTRLSAKNLDTGGRLTRRPRHQLQFGLQQSLADKRGNLSFNLTWQSEEFIDDDNEITSPSFAQADLKFEYRLRPGLHWYGGIDNVLDEHRNPENPGRDFRPLEPRFIYSGLRWQL